MELDKVTAKVRESWPAELQRQASLSDEFSNSFSANWRSVSSKQCAQELSRDKDLLIQLTSFYGGNVAAQPLEVRLQIAEFYNRMGVAQMIEQPFSYSENANRNFELSSGLVESDIRPDWQVTTLVLMAKNQERSGGSRETARKLLADALSHAKSSNVMANQLGEATAAALLGEVELYDNVSINKKTGTLNLDGAQSSVTNNQPASARYERAREHLSEAVTIMLRMFDKDNNKNNALLKNPMWELALVDSRLGRTDAPQHFDDYLNRFYDKLSWREKAEALRQKGNSLFALHQSEDAMQALRVARTTISESSDHKDSDEHLFILSDLAVAECGHGHYADAEIDLKEALKLASNDVPKLYAKRGTKEFNTASIQIQIPVLKKLEELYATEGKAAKADKVQRHIEQLLGKART